MKIIKFLFTLVFMLLGVTCFAQEYKVLVLPADLFNTCENYYCFDEPSEIIARDVITDFNKNGKIFAQNIYETRDKMFANQQLKSTAVLALNKFKNSNYIDFASLKKVANNFEVNSILLISSRVDKRSVWEILEISSVFEAIHEYTLDTHAVLLDNVNDIVMWSGNYQKKLGDNNSRFWAKNTAQAVSQYEKISFYSKDIISKDISQNIIQRFMPKTIATDVKMNKNSTPEFKPNPLENIKVPDKVDTGEIHSESIYSF